MDFYNFQENMENKYWIKNIRELCWMSHGVRRF